jgi:alpha-amylase/alpha-mannosidase (GH57 family)
MLHVAFLWHMHQPFYGNPLTGEYSLPWVRLHAVKGYYDMISLLEDYPAIRQTFNLVPSLIRQLGDYARGEAQDLFLEYSRKPAEDLSLEEKKFILVNFFMCSWETMVKPYPGYWDLLKKRGLKIPESRLDELVLHFSVQDFRDLQVWFNLTWCGYRARREKEGLRELLKKGRGFSQGEKIYLLNTQREIIQKLIPLYKAARSKGQVEITTSPFYHPILPLLIDWNLASRAMPRVALPGSFSHPEDAEAQIQKAVAHYEEVFGSKPQGMWPSEGSVCPEMIPIVQRLGIRWMATDEGILFKSVNGNQSRSLIYQPYRADFQGAEVAMVFRDRNLSDLIGFTYSKNPPQASVNDFLAHLQNIDHSLPRNRDWLALVALDGENPWEYYADGGFGFLSGIYERLSRDPAIQTIQVGEFLESHPPQEDLDSLHTGSWIDQNFRIWIGSQEDNLAWNCLKQSRDFLAKATFSDSPLNPKKKELAWEEIYIAEGSDWFWWFGDDFSSDNDEEFDRLFRVHLSNIYLLLGSEVPDYLKRPISMALEVQPTLEPLGFISPILDGQVTHFYEWREAGYCSAKTTGGSMYRGEGHISGFYYGFDPERLHFRIDPIWRKTDPLQGLTLNLHILRPRDRQILFPMEFPPGESPFYELYLLEGKGLVSKGRLSQIGLGKIIELSLPLEALQFRPQEEIHFVLQVQRGNLEVERVPRNGYLSLRIPDREFEFINWQM